MAEVQQKTAFTPGPWTKEFFSIIAKAQDGATLRIARATPIANYVSIGEANANARLIAKAAELFALLKASQEFTSADWRQRRDALIAEIEGR